MIKYYFLLLLLFITSIGCAQDKQDAFTNWALSIQGNYMIQDKAKLNTPDAYFDIRNMIAPTFGIDYQIIRKEHYTISSGAYILIYFTQIEPIIRTNNKVYDLGRPAPTINDDPVLKLPIHYQGSWLQPIGLSEYAKLEYNIPTYRYEFRSWYSINDELVYKTYSKADKNYFSAGLGIKKEIPTKTLQLGIALGVNADLQDYLDTTVELGGGESSIYTIRTNAVVMDVTFRPRRFKIVSK